MGVKTEVKGNGVILSGIDDIKNDIKKCK